MVVTKVGSINNNSVYFTAKTHLALDVMCIIAKSSLLREPELRSSSYALPDKCLK